MFPRIDKHSYIPAYIQIKDHFLRLIETNVLKPGDQLPPEHEIVRETGLSRMTVRQGIQKLVQMGYLTAHRGLGTFVAHKSENVDTMAFTSLSKKLSSYNQIVTSEINIFEERKASKEISDVLGIAEGGAIWYLDRVRSINGIISLHEISYLPKDLFPTLTKKALANSKYKWVQDNTSNAILFSEKSYIPLLAKGDISKILCIEENTPVIKACITSYLDNHRAFEYNVIHYRPDYPHHTLQSYRN